MLQKLFDKIRPFLGRIIGVPVGALLGAAAAKTGVQEIASPETQAAVVGAIVYAGASIVNTLVNKKVNPTNSATTELAKVKP